MIYLLDTNPCVVYLRGENPLLRQRIRSRPVSDIAICSVVSAELYHGAERSSDPARSRMDVERFTRPYLNLPFTEDEARIYARIRFDLESRGERIGEMDMQIASIAISHSLTIVTHNISEFSRIPNLMIVDWEVP